MITSYFSQLSRLTLVAWLGLSTMSSAQAPALDPATNTTSQASLKRNTFQVTCLGEWDKAELYTNASRPGERASYTQIDILDMGYSPAMRYRSGRPIKFYKKTDDEEKPYAEVLSVSLPQGIKKPLIVLIPSEDKVNYKVIDVSPTATPYGSIRAINLSKTPLRFAVDKDIRSLKSNTGTLFPAIQQDKKAAWLRAAAGNSNKYIFTSMTMRRSGKRVILFFIDNPEKGAPSPITNRMLIDFKPVNMDKS